MTHRLYLFLAIFLFHISEVHTDPVKLLTHEDMGKFEHCDGRDLTRTSGFPLEKEKNCSSFNQSDCMRIILKEKMTIEHINLEVNDGNMVEVFIENKEGNLTKYENRLFYEEVNRIVMQFNLSMNMCRIRIFARSEDFFTEVIERLTKKHLENFESCNGLVLSNGSGYPLEEDGFCWNFNKGECVKVKLNQGVSVVEVSFVLKNEVESTTPAFDIYLFGLNQFTKEHEYIIYHTREEPYEGVDEIKMEINREISLCWVKIYAFIEQETTSIRTPTSTPTILEKTLNTLTGIKKAALLILFLAFTVLFMAWNDRRKPAFDWRKSNSSIGSLDRKLDIDNEIDEDMKEMLKNKLEEPELPEEKVDLGKMTKHKLREVKIIAKINEFSLDVLKKPKIKKEFPTRFKSVKMSLRTTDNKSVGIRENRSRTEIMRKKSLNESKLKASTSVKRVGSGVMKGRESGISKSSQLNLHQ